jgi:hypothetical protein
MVLPSRTLTVSIDCPSGKAYDFMADPRNLPLWASGLGASVKEVNGRWVMDTPQGQVGFRYMERNSFGVLDHFVTVAPGVEVYIPMRVLPNGQGSEVVFTLFRTPDMSEEQFAADAELVAHDLETLKSILEAHG